MWFQLTWFLYGNLVWPQCNSLLVSNHYCSHLSVIQNLKVLGVQFVISIIVCESRVFIFQVFMNFKQHNKQIKVLIQMLCNCMHMYILSCISPFNPWTCISVTNEASLRITTLNFLLHVSLQTHKTHLIINKNSFLRTFCFVKNFQAEKRPTDKGKAFLSC